MAATRSDDEDLIAGINVTPLVDVVLVLLVVLMVTATYVTRQVLPIELPTASQRAAPPSHPVDITVDARGGIAVDGAPSSTDELRAILSARVRAEPDLPATVAADVTTSHGAVVRVLDELRAAHVQHVAIRTRPPSPR